MSRDLIINVELLAGSDIANVASQAIRLAKHLDVGITFDFNGVHLIAFEGSSADAIVKEYRQELKRKHEG